MVKTLCGWLAVVLPWSQAARFALWITACVFAALMCVLGGAAGPRAAPVDVPAAMAPATAAPEVRA